VAPRCRDRPVVLVVVVVVVGRGRVRREKRLGLRVPVVVVTGVVLVECLILGVLFGACYSLLFVFGWIRGVSCLKLMA
jgi:hypothetical protein